METQDSSSEANIDVTVPFKDGIIRIDQQMQDSRLFKLVLALVEVLGENFIESLKKQGLHFDEDVEKQIRNLL